MTKEFTIKRVIHSKKSLFLVLFLVLLCNTLPPLQAQSDTEFWFAAPEVTAGHGDEPIFMCFSTSDVAATVTISMPSNAAFVPIILNIAADDAECIDVTAFKDDFESFPYNAILNTGILVSATATITAYYEVRRNNNPDIFALKGRNGLGTAFHVPMQTQWDHQQGLNPNGHSGFIIVATENNTEVEITPSRNVIGRPAGVPYTIVLNRGESYCAAVSQPTAAQVAPNGFPAGSVVTSNKPIAITLYHDSIRTGTGGCYDLAGDQLVPDNIIGTDYIVLRGQLAGNEIAYVLAIEDNTEVFVAGVSVATINKGEQHQVNIPNTVPRLYINTDKPVYVIHLSGFGCETGLAILPPIECTGSRKVFFARATDETFFVNLMVRDGFQDLFRYNGGAPNTLISAADFNVVPGTAGEWYSAQIPFTDVATTPTLAPGAIGTIENDGALFHMGLVNGGASSGCRYGYFSSFNALDLGPDINVDYGTVVTLDAGTDGLSYLWNTGETTQTIEVGLWEWGEYWVEVDVGSCVLRDSVCVGTNQFIWKGDKDPDLTALDPDNWSKPCGLSELPDCTVDIRLPDDPIVNYEMRIDGELSVNNVYMENNSILRITSTGILNVCGDFIHEGSLIMDEGAIIRFIGTRAQRYIRTATATGEFENVVINNTTIPLSNNQWAHVIIDDNQGIEDMIISETGSLVFESGAILTEGEREVLLKNREPNALRFGANLPSEVSPNCGIETFVIGRLRRHINPRGIYNFPVGIAILQEPVITNDPDRIANLQNGVTWQTDNYCGEDTEVVQFRRNNNHFVNLPNTIGVNSNNERTIEMWALLEGGTGGNPRGLFQMGENANLRDFALEKLNGNNDNWEMRFGGTSNVVTLPGSSAGWHHYAMTYDGTTVRLYYDGNIVSAAAEIIINLNTTFGNRYIGRSRNNYFNGRIDNVRVWSVARTQEEIQASSCILFECELPTGLQVQYDFEEGSGTVANYKVYDCAPPVLQYQLAEIEFYQNSWTTADNLMAEFFQYDAVPGPTGQTNICNTDFDVCDALNHGFWRINAYDDTYTQFPSNIGRYGITLYNCDYTNLCLGLGAMVMKRNTEADPWAIPIPDAVCINDNPAQTTLGLVQGFSDFGVAQAEDMILPVDFTGIWATPKTDFIQIGWTAVEEIDIEGYEILRATDETNFEKIGKVALNPFGEYIFDDKNVERNQMYYYRVRSIEILEENASYSRIVNAKLEGLGNGEMTLYPNPSKGEFFIEFAQATQARVTVFDALGSKVLDRNISANNGEAQRFSIQNQAQGMYLIQVQTNKGMQVFKLIKE
ncbi:MAG: T9SS type A sorting domain-containing protein [Bernardetiaceae bacterium]|nr:T9SS type A sorting domain-containing protein [Bernardetiaceae bacterium]